jgi:ligand-binding SRPBCC domain-containing protein
MLKYERSIDINAPIEKVFHFHDDTTNLLKITPPETKVDVLRMDKPGKGQRVTLSVTQFGFFKSKWDVEITEYDPPVRIVDKALHSPFSKWTQIRTFTKLDEQRTRMTDTVEYELPLHAVTDFFAKAFIGKEISKMFEYRQRRTKEVLENGSTT